MGRPSGDTNLATKMLLNGNSYREIQVATKCSPNTISKLNSLLDKRFPNSTPIAIPPPTLQIQFSIDERESIIRCIMQHGYPGKNHDLRSRFRNFARANM